MANVSLHSMVSSLKSLSLSDKRRLAEAVQSAIAKEEKALTQSTETSIDGLLAMAGSLSEQEVVAFEQAVNESRQVAETEW